MVATPAPDGNRNRAMQALGVYWRSVVSFEFREGKKFSRVLFGPVNVSDFFSACHHNTGLFPAVVMLAPNPSALVDACAHAVSMHQKRSWSQEFGAIHFANLRRIKLHNVIASICLVRSETETSSDAICLRSPRIAPSA